VLEPAEVLQGRVEVLEQHVLEALEEVSVLSTVLSKLQY
jgi:hypothetical protein